MKSQRPAPTSIAGRYRVERPIGVGGMATVYEVLDTASGQRVALKQLHEQSDGPKRERTVELFEREFHTLSHLAHPRIVQAYDYGIDQGTPYYTMELLQGGELSSLVPLPWKRASEVARDICSALSLVHSRRLVYRDLNPRNVHCTSDGHAKLIDFGALCPLGPAKQVVGTPAYCAPEALDFAPLDARTDLYSVGALLYLALTGRHAFPARSFEQLRLLWETRPPRPSELVPDVPLALDNLVMDLLHIEPAVRPANAAEVLDQLAAIEGRTLHEQVQVTLAYLSTPHLVGREAALTRARTKIKRAQRSRGGVLLFEGVSGAGRSRIVAACRLEAKLQGLLTVQADASDAGQDYGVVHALVAQLLTAAPQQAIETAEPYLPVLGQILPALLALRPDTALQVFSDPTRLRSVAIGALRDWLFALSAQRPLLIAVDDLHAVDELSAALLALLARGLENHALLLVASVETGASVSAPGPVKVFSATATTERLENLTQAETEQLLRSVFGDVPHVQLLTHRLHRNTQGKPRDLMQLAEYLVDRGLATFRSGVWSLPSQIDEADLPNDMAEALAARVRTLGPLARRLGLAVTLSPDRGLSTAECITLCDGASHGDVLAALDELHRIQAIVQLAECYAISQQGFVVALQAGADDDQSRHLHALLARVFELRGHEAFRCAQHLVRAGELDRGLDVLVEFAIESKRRTDVDTRVYASVIAALPEDWLQFYVEAIEQCERRGRPIREAHALRLRFVSMANVTGTPASIAASLIGPCLQDLRRASGLDDLVAQPDAVDPTLAARIAIGAAQQHYEQSPDQLRLVPAMVALTELSRTMIATAGLVTLTLDYGLALAMPNLAGFTALSPALEIVEWVRRGTIARMSGRYEVACQIYHDLLVFSDRSDYAGLDASNHHFLRIGLNGALGLMEAATNMDACPALAAQVESEPLYMVHAAQIRIVHALWEGRVHDADKIKAHCDLLRLQNGPRQIGDGAYLIARVTANAASDDLTRIKETAEDVQAIAVRHAPWGAVAEYARGEYERIRGNTGAALEHLDAALALCSAGAHQIWPYAAGARVHVLRLHGELEEARSSGEVYLALAEQHVLGWHANFIKLPLALALAKLGDAARAASLADAVITHFAATSRRGLPMVLAYEARARVALDASDDAAYESALNMLAEQARAGQGRGLRAKYERLKQDSQGQGRAFMDAGTGVISDIQLREILSGCPDWRARAQRSLQLLLQRSGAVEGWLYWQRPSGRELVARLGDATTDVAITRFLDEFLESQLQAEDINTCSQETVANTAVTSSIWTGADGTQHHAVLLSHQVAQGLAITGLAIVRMPPQVQFSHPTTLASNLSRALIEAGDVVLTIAR